MPEKEKEYILVNGDKTVFTTDRDFAMQFLFGASNAVVVAQPQTAPPLEEAPDNKGKPKGKRGGYHPRVEGYNITQTDEHFVIHYPSGDRAVPKKIVIGAADALRQTFETNGGKPVTASELAIAIGKNPDPDIARTSLTFISQAVLPIFKHTGAVDYLYGKHRLILMKPKINKPTETAAPIETAPAITET